MFLFVTAPSTPLCGWLAGWRLGGALVNVPLSQVSKKRPQFNVATAKNNSNVFQLARTKRWLQSLADKHHNPYEFGMEPQVEPVSTTHHCQSSACGRLNSQL